jgi:hypothetical protein
MRGVPIFATFVASPGLDLFTKTAIVLKRDRKNTGFTERSSRSASVRKKIILKIANWNGS